MTLIRTIFKNEPAIATQGLALIGLILAAVFDAIALEGGDLVAVVGAVLAAAGVTRQQVTPTSKALGSLHLGAEVVGPDEPKPL